jgi:SLOG family YspA-like protein
MRVCVTGGRDFDDGLKLYLALDELHAAKGPITLIIQGGATGADHKAAVWAEVRGIRCQTFPADWTTSGPAAGPIRNREMMPRGNPDIVVAFAGGRGTQNAIDFAKALGIEVLDLRA